ncbi:ankyrin [Mollisia scopiformis]|uniref:Ankyrin n=1 Tax=Mollisia scopiformis TaxID=149040 RepID=A0A194XRZ8_MOLSC|nr:ankyrin [Mollisia scopiformis]KUJ22968.1 ankyrin [Mollisia scopiformis]
MSAFPFSTTQKAQLQIHGLQGHPRKTWTCESNPRQPPYGSSEPIEKALKKLFSRKHKTGHKDTEKRETAEVFWPLDLLPLDCTNSRILTWGYDSKVSHFFGGASNQSNITAHAQNLLAGLKRSRLDCPGRSILFVAHSLGEPMLLDIYSSTFAITFLGTPHFGSNKAGIAEVARRMASVSGFDTTDKNIRALQVDSTELELIHELFLQIYDCKERPFQVITFQEAKGIAGINYLKLNEKVVEPFSSRIGNEPVQTINANHMSMCRFPSRDDEGYKQVVGEVTIQLSGIQSKKNQDVTEGNKEMPHVYTGFSSPSTASAVHSLTDAERNSAEYKSSLPARVEGTCQWILSNYKNLDWNMQDKTCLLWIIGYPGSGKTILSAYLLECLGSGDHSPNSRSTTLCYFFCDEKIETQRDGRAIIRSLIHQLLMRRRSLIKYVKAAYDVAGPQFDQSFHGLWKIFIAIARDKRVGPLNVLIDAIDECEQITREEFLRDIVDLINHSQDDIQQDLQLSSIPRLKVSPVELSANQSPSITQGVSSNSRNSYQKSLVGSLRRLVAEMLIAQACVSYLSLDDFRRDFVSQDQQKTKVEESPISPVSKSMEGEALSFWDMVDLGEDALFRDPSATEAEACAFIETQHPFYDYSARHWAQHFSSAYMISPQTVRNAVIELSDVTSRQGLNWFRYYWLYAETELAFPRDFVLVVTASYFGHLTSLDSLLPEGMYIEPQLGGRAIYWGARMGHHAVVDKLLEVRASPDISIINGQTALTAAVQFNRLNVVKSLLKEEGLLSESDEYRVNHAPMQGRTPLSIAAGNGLVEIVRELLRHSRIQPDIADFDQWTPLFWSTSGNHLDVLQLLIIDGRMPINHVDKSGRNVLSWAASAGEPELVKYLLSLDHLRADEPDRHGRTALSWAAGNGHLETTMIIRRSQRIHASIKDNDGRNALSWACRGGHYQVIEYLIKHDRKGVDEEDVDSWTPLAWALFSQAPRTVQVLLDSGLVDVNKKDRNGRSALSFAAGYGYLEVVQILLRVRGIEIDSEDNDGRTPLSHVARHKDVVKALEQAGE